MSTSASPERAASTPTATLRADWLKLSLVARRATRDVRWCVLSTGYSTNTCNRRSGRYRVPVPSLMVPLHNHGLLAVAERTRLLHGTAEVKRVFGRGIRALREDRDAWKVPS